MMRIEGRAARASRAAADAPGPRGAIEGKARPRLARRVVRASSAPSPARRRETRGARPPSRTQCGGPATRGAHQSPTAGGRGKGPDVLCRRRPRRPVRPVQKHLVLAFQLVVEHDARDACPFVLQATGLRLIQPIELRVVRQLARLDQARVILLDRPSAPRRDGRQGAPSPRV